MIKVSGYVVWIPNKEVFTTFIRNGVVRVAQKIP